MLSMTTGCCPAMPGGVVNWSWLVDWIATPTAEMASNAVERVLPILNVHVLVVEDNAVNRRVAVAFLGKVGCTVETAANGVDAAVDTGTDQLGAGVEVESGSE